MGATVVIVLLVVGLASVAVLGFMHSEEREDED